MPLVAEQLKITTRNDRTLILVYLNDCPITGPHETMWYTMRMPDYTPSSIAIDPALEAVLRRMYEHSLPLLTSARLKAANNELLLQLSLNFLPYSTPQGRLAAITALMQSWAPPSTVSHKMAVVYTQVLNPKGGWNRVLERVKEFMFLEALNALLAKTQGQ